jgi:Holliday junction resolvasome RuvABC DNA-binding subunit
MEHEARAEALNLFAFDDPSFIRDWFFDLHSSEGLGPPLADIVTATFETHATALYRPN